MEELSQGSAFLQGTYELKQLTADSHITTKVFYSSFDPPEDSTTSHTVRFGDFSSKLSLDEYDFMGSDFLEANDITTEEMFEFVSQLDTKIIPYRSQLVR